LKVDLYRHITPLALFTQLANGTETLKSWKENHHVSIKKNQNASTSECKALLKPSELEPANTTLDFHGYNQQNHQTRTMVKETKSSDNHTLMRV
jgi:hypothetical protein